MQPVDIRRVGEKEILMIWQDGHRSLFNVYFLRCACQCAECVDESTGRKKLSMESIAPDVKPLRIHPVGRYALRFDWSDGHQSGIYPFDYLRSICPCPACKSHCSLRDQSR